MREEFNDLRGVLDRAIHRDDAVVISGAEYMRKTRVEMDAGFLVDEIREWADAVDDSDARVDAPKLREWADRLVGE